MDNADQELERGDEPVRNHLRRESADGRTQPQLTYTECLEPPALGIEHIDDRSTETKRRVEQIVVTIREQLVRELRSRKIFTMDEGNRFVPEFIANFNSQLGIDESQLYDEHRPLLPEEDPIKACLLA